MPQFDPNEILPQIIWLVLVFGVFYLIVQALYPRLERVLQDRKNRIASDLREAEAAHEAARSATQGSSATLAEARAEALALTSAARDKAAAATRAQLTEAEARLRAQADAAAADLDRQRALVEAELDQVAANAAAQLVQRLAGIEIPVEDAATAVGKVAA